ncbi:MAG TPA: hypothetical protein VK196_02725 [Magnetospirillum sp.]|nr:hypothetical protein [Magnetospirillum sp.]
MFRVVMKALGRDDTDLYVFDLALGADHKPLPGMPFFGVWGKVTNEDDRFPAILAREGTIDLGRQAATHWPRMHRTNLRERQVVVDEYVTVWRTDLGETEEEITYRIASVERIGGSS